MKDAPLYFGLGGLFVVVTRGATAWARELKLDMPWWKWSLSALWYGLLNLVVAVAFTLRGEKENKASDSVLVYGGGLAAITGLVLLRIVTWGRESRSSDQSPV